MRFFIKTILCLGAVAMLSACETPLKVQTLPDITFAKMEPFRLNVVKIETVSGYKAPLKAPNVDHLFKITPERALKDWARDRLAATGAEGTARFVIKNAAAIETKLKIDKGFTGQFKKELSERYTVYIEAELRVMDGTGSVRTHSVKTEKESSITEDASLNQREKLWHDITRAAMANFNASMDGVIKTHFKGWLN
jgi:hypothetical protein